MANDSYCLSISLSKIFNSKGLEITIPNSAANINLGKAVRNCLKNPPFLRMDATINLSKLNIIKPHKIPKKAAIQILSKTVFKAYPADNAAKIPVNKITPPIPACLLNSDGDLRNMATLLPEHKIKNFCNPFIQLFIKRNFVLPISNLNDEFVTLFLKKLYLI